MTTKYHQKSSEILLNLIENSPKQNFTYGKIIDSLQARAFGIGLLLFSLPSALPFSIIPGFSVIFSLPIAIFAVQLIFAQKKLWLPKFIANKEIPHAKLAKVVKYSVPFLKKIEYFLKPRWEFMTSPIVESISGIIIFFIAILLMLPIPFSNFIYALVLILFSLGITEKDGLALFIAFIAAILALGLIPLIIALITRFF